MTSPDHRARDLAADLRRAFDESFRAAPAGAPGARVDVLLIRLAGVPYALRLAEVKTLVRDARVTPLPAAVPEFAGLAYVNDALVPVYDLAALLGHPPAGAAPWLAVAAGPASVGLAFEGLDGHARVTADSIVSAAAGAGARAAGGVLTLEEGPRPVIAVTALLDIIAERAGVRPARETA